MCSWCRIAWRWGDLEASRSGGAGGASATLAYDPEILARPLLPPLGGDSLVVAVVLRVRRRVDLDETFDLETGLVKKVDPVAVGEVVLGALLVRPAHPVHPRLRTMQLLVSVTGIIGKAEVGEHRVGQKDEPAVRTQQPSRLGNPQFRIGPEG